MEISLEDKEGLWFMVFSEPRFAVASVQRRLAYWNVTFHIAYHISATMYCSTVAEQQSQRLWTNKRWTYASKQVTKRQLYSSDKLATTLLSYDSLSNNKK